MLDVMKKIHGDTKLTAVFYGTVSSLIAAMILQYSPSIFTFLSEYTFGLLKNYVDSRYAKSSTLEATNYSYFIITFIFVILCVVWLEVSGRISTVLKLEDNKDKKTNNEVPPKWASKAFLFVKILIGFYLFSGLLFIAGEIMILNNITDFKQHIRILTPYMTEKKKNELISAWSQMRGLDDYNKLYKDIESISKENKLILYKNVQY